VDDSSAITNPLVVVCEREREEREIERKKEKERKRKRERGELFCGIFPFRETDSLRIC
jgi:hypothetical protein